MNKHALTQCISQIRPSNQRTQAGGTILRAEDEVEQEVVERWRHDDRSGF